LPERAGRVQFFLPGSWVDTPRVTATSSSYWSYFSPEKGDMLPREKERGMPHEYEQILRRHQFANQAKNLELLKQKHNDVYPYSVSNLEKGYEFLIDVTLAAG